MAGFSVHWQQQQHQQHQQQQQQQQQPSRPTRSRPEFSIASGISSIVGGGIGSGGSGTIGGSRIRSLSEQEREIVSRVVGTDKSSVWHVCQNLRESCQWDDALSASQQELGSYGPEFRKRSCWKPRSGGGGPGGGGLVGSLLTETPTSPSSQFHSADRKSRMSVARTQEAAPCSLGAGLPGQGGRYKTGGCCGPAAPRAASKLVEKVIATHRAQHQALSSGRKQQQQQQPQQPQQQQQQPQQQELAPATRKDPSPGPLPAGASRSPSNSIDQRRAPQPQPQPQPVQKPPHPAGATETGSKSPTASTGSSGNSASRRRSTKASPPAPASAPMNVSAIGDSRQSPPGLRRGIRFLPLADAIENSVSQSVRPAAGRSRTRDLDWDLGEADIRRLIHRRRLDSLMLRRSHGQGGSRRH